MGIGNTMDKSPHLLIVEDSKTQALRLTYQLTNQGYRVSHATTAEETLTMLGKERPDLLLLDYHLPGMDGDELCRRLRINANTRDLPILMLTGESDDLAQQKVLESGADDYLDKNEHDEILFLHIQSLLRRSQARQSVFTAELIQNIRILAIDDSATFRAFLSAELSSEGYDVHLGATGQEGLQKFRSETFDAILVDLNLPDIDGFELCRQLAIASGSPEAPVVIVLAGSESREDIVKAMAAGAEDFVSKSSDIGLLKSRLHSRLRRRFFEREKARIAHEFATREQDIFKARAEKEAAEAKAALAEALEKTNKELEATNQQLREAQSQLVQSEKMASIGQLTAGIAHEINNPMAYVINNLFSVQKWIKQVFDNTPLPPEATEKLNKATSRLNGMKEGLERVKDLVLKLRTFSRLDEGEFKTVDIHESIDAALTFLHHRMKNRIQITKNYGPQNMLSCYAGQLNQVILNILANAVDAIDAEGEITITTQIKNDLFSLSIRDTGCGMPDHIRNRIFDPFFTTKPIGEGTGLGLSISYGIIQKHQGNFEVKSEEGKGTEFCIHIPTHLEGTTP